MRLSKLYFALFLLLLLLLAACGGGSEPAAEAASAGGEQPASDEAVASDGEEAAPAEAGGKLDPAKVSPEVFQVLLDGPRARVLTATWQPGQRDNLHGHPLLVAYALTPIFGLGNEGTGDDETQVSIRIRKDQALIQEPVHAHAFENRGKEAAKMLIFEFKDGRDSAPAPKGTKEANVVSKDIYELVAFDTRIHVLRATFKPGSSDEFHGHPASILYALTDFEGKVFDPEDKPKPVSLKAGQVMFMDAEEHRIEYTGAADAQLLIVEDKQ